MPLLVAQRGHCFRTTGATGTSGEQAMTKDVCDKLATMVPPGWTLRIINADVDGRLYRGDAFVAVHGDGGASTSHGASVGYQNEVGNVLAQAWKRAYVACGWPGGWHNDNYTDALHNYYGVRHARNEGNNRAFVLEVGFMTNPADRKWIDANHTAIARSIWQAVAGTAGGEDDVLDYFEVTVICYSATALARLKALCASLGIKEPAVITVVPNIVYAAKTHASKAKAEVVQTSVKGDGEMDSFKGIPTTAETVASIGIVKDSSQYVPPTGGSEELAKAEAIIDRAHSLAQDIVALTT